MDNWGRGSSRRGSVDDSKHGPRPEAPDRNRTVPLFFNYPKQDCIPTRLLEIKRNRPTSPRRGARQRRRSDAAIP